MKTWVRKTLSAGVLAAGALLFAPGAAHADVWQGSGGNSPINVPINACGNSLALLGGAYSGADCSNEDSGPSWRAAHLESAQVQGAGSHSGALNATQAAAPINIPINVCGNSLGILGSAGSFADCGNDVFDPGFAGDGFRDARFGHHSCSCADHRVWIHGHRHSHPTTIVIVDNGHHKKHHKGHGVLAADNGVKDGSYLGDNGTKPTKVTKPAKPATSNAADNGVKDDNAGYGNKGNLADNGVKDDNAGYGDKGRG